MSDSARLFSRIHELYRANETTCVKGILAELEGYSPFLDADPSLAKKIIEDTRNHLKSSSNTLHTLIQSIDLSQEDSILFMSLAEALPRTPDAFTQKALIQDILKKIDLTSFERKDSPWVQKLGLHLGRYLSRLLQTKEQKTFSIKGITQSFLRYPGLVGARLTLRLILNSLAQHFVMSETLEKALSHGEKKNTLYSFDMLGEAALTEKDAKRYFENYKQAILSLATSALKESSSISVKLSALHPRYEFLKRSTVLNDLYERIYTLACLCAEHDIELTIDAEESERLTLSLEIFERLVKEPKLQSWQGLGLALQAYQKRALAVIDWLKALSDQHQRRIPIRLVKGAYWDSEIKTTQENGLEGYAVFTRKASTDLSYLACAIALLRHPSAFKPQFATHNAHTIATILSLPECPQTLEFQRLHGMGEALYEAVMRHSPKSITCRVYAPIGSYHELLPYLIRRLIENGSNSSFVHKISQPELDDTELLSNPIHSLKNLESFEHPAIPLPRHIFGTSRLNSPGLDLSFEPTLNLIQQSLVELPLLSAHSIVDGESRTHAPQALKNPSQHANTVGHYSEALSEDIHLALVTAQEGFKTWSTYTVEQRARILESVAEALEEKQRYFSALLIREAGKTVKDAVNEVREAIDFCRYYAEEGRRLFNTPMSFKSITGESNTLTFEGRGTFVCISPWNFPLAIFLGQITAALMAGNAVIAKPAEQTPFVAYEATRLLLKAGVPEQTLQLILGDGHVGSKLVADTSIAGVAFTGSFAVAKEINRSLAEKSSPIVPLIAETGGQNALFVDSSALPEQVVRDILSSAFQSAGQRCSCLRILLVQEECADTVLQMLKGAIDTLVIGHPEVFETDLGPLIDADAHNKVEHHKRYLETISTHFHEAYLPEDLKNTGYYTAPAYYEINTLDEVREEIFGPILHVYRYKSSDLASLIERINQLGFGLTGGIHSRVSSHIDLCSKALRVGNFYINRNMIGAVVGVQPFGGHGLSGTGPKAGGPFYLTRFAQEKSFSHNLTAFGGNLSLLALP